MFSLSIAKQISGFRRQKAIDLLDKRRELRCKRNAEQAAKESPPSPRRPEGNLCPENLRKVVDLVGSLESPTAPAICKLTGINDSSLSRILRQLVSDDKIVIAKPRQGNHACVYALYGSAAPCQPTISPKVIELLETIRSFGGRATARQLMDKLGCSRPAVKGILQSAIDLKLVSISGTIKEKGKRAHIYGALEERKSESITRHLR